MTIEAKLYSTNNLNEMMGKFEFPSEEIALFNLVLKAYNDMPTSKKINQIEIEAGSDGGTQFKTYTIILPISGTLAAMPVSSLAGTSGIGYTFGFYDEYSVVVHELSHFILDLLGAVYFKNIKHFDDPQNGAELNQAVLAAAWRQSNGNLDTLVNYLSKWTNETKLIVADMSGASFENIFNNDRNFYADVAGISNASDLQRVGYQTHRDTRDQIDGVWHAYEGDRATIPGNYNYILQNDSEGIVVLGNEYDNNAHDRTNGLIGTATHDDCLDGGNGNDYLRGDEGNDTLYGESGDDYIEGATQTATGTFTRTNGTKGEVGNLNFASNAFYLSRHPELVSGSQITYHVRNDGDAVNNLESNKVRRVA